MWGESREEPKKLLKRSSIEKYEKNKNRPQRLKLLLLIGFDPSTSRFGVLRPFLSATDS